MIRLSGILFMFLKPQRTLPLFIALLQIIMSFLNFTLISFLSRIGSQGKLFFKASLMGDSILSHAAPHPQLQTNKLLVPSRFSPLDDMLD
jgi:hypothetical protein